MSDSGYFAQSNRSPKSLSIVLLAHAAVLTALALSKTYVENKPRPAPIDIEWIKSKEDPPEVKPDPPKPQPERHVSTIDRVERIVRTPIDDFVGIPIDDFPSAPLGPIGAADSGPIEPPRVDPLPEPVRIGPRIDPRSELQPPYPASEQREANEGSVAVRLLIGADGRVKAVEKVRATSDAFFRATERHALRAWRFKPATLDGKAIESRFTMTVTFRLEG